MSLDPLRHSYVYIMTDKPRGVLYIGVTSDLVKRVYEHRAFVIPSCFTAKYKLNKLVFYECHSHIEHAIQREKTMKHWVRQWKINAIEANNPNWDDLYDTLF